MSQKPVKIPQRIDEPLHFYIWSLDELAPALIGLCFGMLIAQALICSVIGLTLTYAYRKFRETHPDGYFVHLMYWVGLPVTNNKAKSFINPFIRRLLP